LIRWQAPACGLRSGVAASVRACTSRVADAQGDLQLRHVGDRAFEAVLAEHDVLAFLEVLAELTPGRAARPRRLGRRERTCRRPEMRAVIRRAWMPTPCKRPRCVSWQRQPHVIG